MFFSEGLSSHCCTLVALALHRSFVTLFSLNFAFVKTDGLQQSKRLEMNLNIFLEHPESHLSYAYSVQ